MGLGYETQHRGHSDIGVADTAAEPVIASPVGAISFEGSKHRGYLSSATVDPYIGYLLVQPLLVKQAHRLVAHSRCKACYFQRLVPGGLPGRIHSTVLRHETVEIIQDGVAFD